MPPETGELLNAMRDAALKAGAMALAWFKAGGATAARIDWKHGGSPVSEADYEVDVYLRETLGALLPDAGWLSEETADSPQRLGKERLFIVDPIDGTRAFIKGDPRWAVSIALVERGRPRLALLHLPATGDMFEAVEGAGARLNGRVISASGRTDLTGALVAGPPRMLDEMASNGLDFAREPRVPSLAYRLAKVGSGEIDAGIASTDAWDWDIAAADLIVHEAGGLLTDMEGRVPAYNAVTPRHGVLGAAPAQLHGALLAAVRRAMATGKGP
ncbi:MAG: inositol monophosphatase [Hyphomicrobiales bacterium]|nr:inositol monophosphatase [Hyphomicrobiales bacterium]